jgi:hypothetical protein
MVGSNTLTYYDTATFMEGAYIAKLFLSVIYKFKLECLLDLAGKACQDQTL